MKFLLIGLASLLVSCAPTDYQAEKIPGPSSKVSRKETMQIAQAYANMKWTPSAINVKHGIDQAGVRVHTPDSTLAAHGFSRGWWTPDKAQIGMPYQWGGFDTPRTFLFHVNRGAAAGDIATPEKRKLGDAAVSLEAAGIDCSGFVSRCWRLRKPFSTAELPGITSPIRWSELQAGDILINQSHVILFAGWHRHGSVILGYEAGTYPAWKVAANKIPTDFLLQQQFQPRRYRHITP